MNDDEDDLDRLARAARVMREHGILGARVGDLEIRLDPSYQPTTDETAPAEPTTNETERRLRAIREGNKPFRHVRRRHGKASAQ